MTVIRRSNAVHARGPVSAWGKQHAKGVAVIRLMVAAWLVILGVVFCALGHWWGVLYFPAAGAVAWLAYQLPRWTAARAGNRASI
jgi:hypothetical protein